MERRKDIGNGVTISVCIVIIAGLLSWFIKTSWGQATKANDRVTVVETKQAVHEEKFITIDRRFDTVITKQETMDGKLDLILAK